MSNPEIERARTLAQQRLEEAEDCLSSMIDGFFDVYIRPCLHGPIVDVKQGLHDLIETDDFMNAVVRVNEWRMLVRGLTA